jgi:hypothetical protein
MPIKWSRAETGKFDQAPQRKPARKIDPEWEELLTALENGDEIQIPYIDEAERRSIARSAGRRAAGRKFKIELRYPHEEKVVLLRKSQELLLEKQPQAASNGRRRKRSLAE